LTKLSLYDIILLKEKMLIAVTPCTAGYGLAHGRMVLDECRTYFAGGADRMAVENIVQDSE
jgi:hypothetical protein